ncbi:photosynthetic NDH subunit of lumenal location 3, chloroplastic [Punica granatum]|uniref:Uncharacterized protein n=2 Tax=Punica granatum TaxID=22663 RepID=A0A218XWR1_PUNGR|nr:photosynthetic NDH subunit of lumenal location 3, chloroplastic [Punica granatum]OWM88722.1 hypothetical protein CDL15_Pgr002489 [Punica granatum]PKI32667.1 hypothetical protein CRG98_046932 [Punica granatum]
MARLANVYGVSETLPAAIPKLSNLQRTRMRPKRLQIASRKAEDFEEQGSLQSLRRGAALGLAAASIALFGSFGNGVARAEDNGYWITGPIPVPPVFNKIANEKTGTRSFVRSGIYIANIGVKGSMYRLKKYAFDLLALGDLIGKDAWNYVRKYLRLKGTSMYYDFDKVISAAPVADKQPLTDLANNLFDSIEKLEDAVKRKDLSATQSCYEGTTVILQEVMNRMA